MLSLKQTLTAVALLVLVAACGFIPETRSWSEDVQLDDGSVITIERYVRFEESNALGGGAYSATETRAKLAFTEELSSLPAWDVPLMPLVLYRDAQTNEWVVVATTGQCEIWDARGQSRPTGSTALATGSGTNGRCRTAPRVAPRTCSSTTWANR